MTKLRKFIMQTLLSYTKSRSGSKPLESGDDALVAMETESVWNKDPKMQDVKDSDKMESESGVAGVKGESGDGVRKGADEDGGGKEGEMEGDSEIEMDAALELVDQMEIEISDGEGGGTSPSAATEGGGEKDKDKEKERQREGGTEKEERAKPALTKEAGRGEGGEHRSSRKRRHSSVVINVEFPAISLEKQLSDRQTVDLMNLLHVCCGLKVSSSTCI